MKKFSAWLLLLVILLFLSYLVIFNSKEQTLSPISQNQPSVTLGSTITSTTSPKITSLFVPYWALSNQKIQSNSDELIYFGITPTANGIDTDEIGYKTIPLFIQDADASQKKLLVVRMINSDQNLSILSSQVAENGVITQSDQIAKKYNFDGVVLDFEISAISFNSLVTQINSFVSKFTTDAKQNNLQFGIALYGDTFYRARPFDVKTIGGKVDRIYVMTYDFSKADGANPGPNFPFSDKQLYGYDFQTMINDYIASVPKQKLSIIYGLFGYDWSVDKNNISNSQAKSLTLKQIQNTYATSCSEKNCKIKQDPISKETEITYTDSSGINHIIWFEDQKSASQKQQFANDNGINGSGYWAYSYY